MSLRVQGQACTAWPQLMALDAVALPVLEYFAVQRNMETAGSLAWIWFTCDHIKWFFDGPLPSEWLITWFAVPLWNSATTLTPCPPPPTDIMLPLFRTTIFFPWLSFSLFLVLSLPQTIYECRNNHISNSRIRKECIIHKGFSTVLLFETIHSIKAKC